MRAMHRVAAGLVLVVTWACAGSVSPPTATGGSTDASGMNTGRSADTMAGGDLDVKLESVTGSRPGRTTSGRNPFRFGSEIPDRPASDGESPDSGSDAEEEPPQGAPPPVVRRSPLRFIGIVDGPSTGLNAVLTDGEEVFHGRQGETVEGRYRIIRVAAERVEIELLPVGGRQVLALEGL